MLPTFLQVSDAKYPETYKGNKIFPLEGRSFADSFKGRRVSEHLYMYWEHMGNQAIRRGNWKATKKEKGEWELYNLSKDNTELHNLASTEPLILKDLTAKWEKWAKEKFVLPKRRN